MPLPDIIILDGEKGGGREGGNVHDVDCVLMATTLPMWKEVGVGCGLVVGLGRMCKAV
jgi:hypothetical protein